MNPSFSPEFSRDVANPSAAARKPEVELSSERKRQALLHAQQMFAKQVDWLTYFREILGVDGIVRQLFPTQAEYLAFETTPEFAEIERQLFKLKSERRNPAPKVEPTRVITVRMPESLHEALRAEALDHQTSINKLCIAKLLQAISGEIAPPARRHESRSVSQRNYTESPVNRLDSEVGSMNEVQ